MKRTLSFFMFFTFITLILTLSAFPQKGGKSPTPTPTPGPGCATGSGNTNSWVGSGGLDGSFGSSGIAVTDLPQSDDDTVTAVMEQADGKIVTVGTADITPSTYNDILVTRYNADGTLDTTFGTPDPISGLRKGYIFIDFYGGLDHQASAVLDAEGRVLLVAQPNIKLARLTVHGDLDSSFAGGSGKTEVTVANLTAGDVTLRSNGKILVTGGEPNFTVAQFNSDGTLDTTFGVNGSVSIDINGARRARESANSIAIQFVGGQERIVLGGGSATGTSTPQRFAVLRLMPNGARDVSFGSNGVTFTSFGGDGDNIFDIAIDSANRIVATGQVYTPCGRDAGFARFWDTGILDTTFSGDGKLSMDIYGGVNYASSLAIQADGKILAGGFATSLSGSVTDFALVRLNTNGSPDASFGPNGALGSGIVTTNIFPTGNYGQAVTLQSDGKILFGGGSSGNGGTSVVARYVQ